MLQLPLPLQIVDYVCGAMKTQAVHACAELGYRSSNRERY